MARYFTVAQANRALPQVERMLRDALFHKEEYMKADGHLKQTAERIRTAGGAHVNLEALRATKETRDRSGGALRDALQEIEDAGVLIKDLDIGLIDFLCMYQDREVCLCWKLGEDAVRFWHGLEEGFRGRKPIDEAFLAGHRGENAN